MIDKYEILGPNPPEWTRVPNVWKLREFILPDKTPYSGEHKRWHEYGMIPGDERYIVSPEPIGQGGLSKVYKGYDIRMDRIVAVKVINPKMIDPAVGLDLQDEAIFMARMEHHPNVVRVYDFSYQVLPGKRYAHDDDPDIEVPVIIMEYIDAPTLKETLEGSASGLPVEEVVAVSTQIADVIDYMISHGVIHRDIKPGNIFLTKQGGVKISDFGLAATIDQANKGSEFIIGATLYSSPESLNGKPITVRSEIYSLAVVSYEMLCGLRPYESSSQAFQQILYGLPIPISLKRDVIGELDRNTLHRLDQVFIKALARKPEDRYSSATEFAKALKDCFITAEEYTK